MHVSLSEVETTVCKAAMAVGLPLGLGEDAGRAARRMMALGVGSFAAFCDAFDAVDQRRSTGFDLERARTGDFGPKPAGRLLSALPRPVSRQFLVDLLPDEQIHNFAALVLLER